MQSARARVEDLRLDTERRLTCKGSALVRFECLNWNEWRKWNKVKEPDPEHVEEIKGIFRKEGCRPLPVKHHLPAMINQHQLNVALENARSKGRWGTDTLPSNFAIINTQDGYPELEFSDGIECLHGLHRIQAGKEWLPPTEKWWIVDLYLSGISYELKTLLVEEYGNERKPCDGEIYRKIHEYKFLSGKIDSKVSPTTCVSLEMRWWARLKGNREKNLRRLFLNSTLTAMFDALSKIPGLFDAGMMITTLHKVLGTKCYEEIQCSLQCIVEVWDGFMRGVKQGLQRVDGFTVKTVELRAPGVSTLDAQFLHGQVLGGTIFSDFNVQERKIIWENILAFKGIIPSLSKFFQDIHFLQACVDAMRWLVTVPRYETVFTALGHGYKSRTENQTIQTAKTTFSSGAAGPQYCKRLGYLHLVAFAMREHQKLPKAPVKVKLKTIPRVKADREVLQRYAAFAEQLGFNTPEIKALKGDLGPLPILDDPLLVPDSPESAPLLVTTGPGESIKQRCGLPHTDTFEEDREYLFLPNLCEERDETGEGITSFFVLKSWFKAFFDPPRWTRPVLSNASQNPTSPHHQHVASEDVNMIDDRPEIPNQREQGQEQQQILQVQDLQGVTLDEQMQENLDLMQQSNSDFIIEGGQTLKAEQETLFVPREPMTWSQATEARNTTVIRFVEREGNEIEMLNPLQEYVGKVLELRLDHGDPTSLVERQVQEFLHNGKRTCDRYKKHIPAEECYNVATRAENKNTLFLIPEIEAQGEVEQQGYELPSFELPNRGDQAMEVLSDPKSTWETIQEQEIEQGQDYKAPEGEYQVAAVLEDLEIPQTPEEEDSDLLDQEKANATNAHILDSNTTAIYLRKNVGDEYNFSKPAKDWEWADLGTLDIPNGDPGGIVEQRMKMLWENRQLKPYDSNLRILQDEDCYRAALADKDLTLYMMKSFHWHEKPNRARFHVSPQAQEQTGLECKAEFIAPSNILKLPSQLPVPSQVPHSLQLSLSPPLPPSLPLQPAPLLPPMPWFRPRSQQELFRSTAEIHRDKIGRGPNQPGNDEESQNRVGMSYMEETSPHIRKRTENIRTSNLDSTNDHIPLIRKYRIPKSIKQGPILEDLDEEEL